MFVYKPVICRRQIRQYGQLWRRVCAAMKNIMRVQQQIRTVFYNISRYYSKPSYIHNIGKLPFRPVTVGKILQESAQNYGKREGIVSHHQNKILTFRQILEDADKLAAGLTKIGVKKGDRVAIWAPNMVEWYLTYMACARGGFLLVTLNPEYEAPEIEYCLNKVSATTVVCAEGHKKQKYYEILQQIHPNISKTEATNFNCNKIPSLKNIIFVSQNEHQGTYKFEDVLNNGDEEQIVNVKKRQDLINPESGFLIQFTSGTTGQPKATLASHFNLVNNAIQIAKRFELDQKYHRVCLQAPLFHALGSTISALVALYSGATEIFAGPSYNPLTTLKTCAEEGCTAIHGTPTMYVDMVNVQEKHNFKLQLEKAVIGLAPCSPELFKKVQKVLGIREVQSVYGLTETTSVAFQSFPQDANNEYKLTQTVGYLSDHIEVKVVDEKDNIVPMGTPGELCIRGYINTLGYWGDEEKTKELMGQDRWLRTGDTFILQEDGYARIVGRIKDMIIRGGENIFPKEIEDFINTHPNVIECFVIGIPDERLGEEVCACLRIKENKTLTLEDIHNFCKGQLAGYKIPKYVHIFTELPKTTSGKIQKYKLKQQVLKIMQK